MTTKPLTSFVIVDVSKNNEVIAKNTNRAYLDYLIDSNPVVSYYWQIREVVPESLTK